MIFLAVLVDFNRFCCLGQNLVYHENCQLSLAHDEEYMPYETGLISFKKSDLLHRVWFCKSFSVYVNKFQEKSSCNCPIFNRHAELNQNSSVVTVYPLNQSHFAHVLCLQLIVLYCRFQIAIIRTIMQVAIIFPVYAQASLCVQGSADWEIALFI